MRLGLGAAATTPAVATQAELCALTTEYVHDSARYQALRRVQRAVVDVAARAGCAILGKIVPRLSQKQKATYVAAYKHAVQGLANAGWLTQAQADELKALADLLANPDVDGDGSPNTEDCAPTDPGVHPGAADEPDLGFVDANCDGIDGDAAGAVFVAPSGSDANPGTQAAPVQTIGAAVALAARRRRTSTPRPARTPRASRRRQASASTAATRPTGRARRRTRPGSRVPRRACSRTATRASRCSCSRSPARAAPTRRRTASARSTAPR
jgi:hypothetical protein